MFNFKKTKEPHQSGPLSRDEMISHFVRKYRVINEEFLKGFELTAKHPKSVTFFGSARFGEGSEWYEKCRSLSNKISKETGYTIVSGGGPGIMEAVNRGAIEAGGTTIGYGIKLPHEQTFNKYVSDFRNFNYFFVRKVLMNYSAEAYIICPGGFGTMDEFFGILTLIQTKKIPRVPIILFCKKYWDESLTPLFDYFIKEGAISQEDMDFFVTTDDMDKIVQIIKKAPFRKE
ncbi:MAG: TIGR00730 family Rossman fold protein [Minisyncoccia bacterium]